jgi:hypothetical protein
MDNLRHMLGAVPGRYPKKQWGFRNHFCAGSGLQTESMRRLVAAGMVVEGRSQEHSTFFHATQKGMESVGMSKAAIKRTLEDE